MGRTSPQKPTEQQPFAVDPEILKAANPQATLEALDDKKGSMTQSANCFAMWKTALRSVAFDKDGEFLSWLFRVESSLRFC